MSIAYLPIQSSGKWNPVPPMGIRIPEPVISRFALSPAALSPLINKVPDGTTLGSHNWEFSAALSLLFRYCAYEVWYL